MATLYRWFSALLAIGLAACGPSRPERPELLVFASDYTHPEGTSDPIGKFEASMPDCDAETLHAFYFGNMAGWMGIA